MNKKNSLWNLNSNFEFFLSLQKREWNEWEEWETATLLLSIKKLNLLKEQFHIFLSFHFDVI
jgi:hypothetical protein